MGNDTIILWSTDLNTGIDVIDSQHKRIVDYINQLGDAIRQQNRTSVGSVLDELVDYTLSHFSFEENLQEVSGYKNAKTHKAVHELFVKRLARYMSKHQAGEDVASQLHAMLSTWLIQHIQRDDMAYVSQAKTSMVHIIENKKESNWLSRSLGRFFK
jgi:hemerythrin